MLRRVDAEKACECPNRCQHRGVPHARARAADAGERTGKQPDARGTALRCPETAPLCATGSPVCCTDLAQGDCELTLRRRLLPETAAENRARNVRKGGPCGLSPFHGLALGCGLVQGHGGANESPQRLLVYLLALVEIDGTPCGPLKTGVEEARRILQSRPFGEGHLHDVLVSLACADQSVVRPHRNPSPLPLLDDFGIGFLD
jgi:hypothetical protein